MYDGDQQINEPVSKGLSSGLHKDSVRRERSLGRHRGAGF